MISTFPFDDDSKEAFSSRLKENAIAARQFGSEYVAKELQLSQKKWFDYRFLTPARATKLFAVEYERSFKQKWRSYIDHKEASLKRGIMIAPHPKLLVTKQEQINLSRENTSLWVARQRADELGLPYDFFIEQTIEAHMRNGYNTLPRPNQLAAGRTAGKVIEKVKDAWQEWTSAQFIVSRLPQYMNYAYKDLSAQKLHRAWALDQLGPGRPLTVGQAVYVRQVLPEADIVHKWGAGRLEQARDAVAGTSTLAPTPVRTEDLWPSCFALPLAFEKGNSACEECPFSGLCERADHVARDKFATDHGDEDPRNAKRREDDRIRQRRYRDRKRAEAAAGKRSGVS